MRLTEEQIRQAILNPEQSVRELAVEYFSQSFSEDISVMPLVIEAVEKYGWENCIRIVYEGQFLPQTESTILWCIQELSNQPAEQEDFAPIARYVNYLSHILTSADPVLTTDKKTEILELPAFDSNFGVTFSERLQFHKEDEETLWSRLTDFCENEAFDEDDSTDWKYAERIVEALGRKGSSVAEHTLSMLNEDVSCLEISPRGTMQCFLLRLAGEFRLKAAIPMLIEVLKLGDEWLNEECVRALKRIGGDEVAEAVTQEFHAADWDLRMTFTSVWEALHTDVAVQNCLVLFQKEEDQTVKTLLGQTALSNFTSAAI